MHVNAQNSITGSTTLSVATSCEPRLAPPTEIAAARGGDFMSSVRALGRNLSFRLRRLCFEEQWYVGVRSRVSGAEAFELNAFYLLNPPHDRFFADPFVAEREGRSYLFLEEFVFATRKGVISCVEFDEQGFRGAPSLVLEAPHHLSYPFLFEWEGQTYMLPESRDSGCIKLFRAVEFPYRWEFAGNLLENLWAVDATIFEHGGAFWMFAGGVKKNGKINSELFLYFAESPLGPWHEHPANPVVADVCRARPAGQIFTHEGLLIRPGQNCSQSYGGATVLNRIDVLSPEEYQETPIKSLGPEWFPGSRGIHTLNHSEHYQAVDVRYLIPQPQLIANKLWWSFRDHFLK
jgi:hypothetical protein